MYNLIQDESISGIHYLNRLHQILLQKLESREAHNQKIDIRHQVFRVPYTHRAWNLYSETDRVEELI
jgi:hypothetical protein